MFRLIKLAAYAVLGYIIYELWQGMNEAQQRGGGGGQRSMMGGGRGQQSFGGGTESASTPGMTGGGSGMMASVVDETGAESQRPVGRGVL